MAPRRVIGLRQFPVFRKPFPALRFTALQNFPFAKRFSLTETNGEVIISKKVFFYAMEVCNEKSFCGAFGRVDDFFRVF